VHVLSSELDLASLDARQWRNGWRLLLPPRVLASLSAAGESSGTPRWALVIVDGSPDRVVKIIVAGKGAKGSIDPATHPLPGVTSKHLESYARMLGVGAVIVIERTVIRQLSAEIESALHFDMDGVAQALTAWKVVKKHVGAGIWTEPPLLDLLPAPAIEPIQRTFDLLIPDRSALVAYVIEDDRTKVHTSIIAVKDGGDITRVATHRAIADLVSETTLARDWRTGTKRVLDAVEERFAKPSIAVFLERATLMKILTGPSDQLAREQSAKNVVIDPAPAWLLGLLGGAAVAAMAGRAGRALAAMLPQGTRDRARGIVNRAQDAMKESGAHPFALLGFDPIELWSQLKRYYQP